MMFLFGFGCRVRCLPPSFTPHILLHCILHFPGGRERVSARFIRGLEALFRLRYDRIRWLQRLLEHDKSAA